MGNHDIILCGRVTMPMDWRQHQPKIFGILLTTAFISILITIAAFSRITPLTPQAILTQKLATQAEQVARIFAGHVNPGLVDIPTSWLQTVPDGSRIFIMNSDGDILLHSIATYNKTRWGQSPYFIKKILPIFHGGPATASGSSFDLTQVVIASAPLASATLASTPLKPAMRLFVEFPLQATPLGWVPIVFLSLLGILCCYLMSFKYSVYLLPKPHVTRPSTKVYIDRLNKARKAGEKIRILIDYGKEVLETDFAFFAYARDSIGDLKKPVYQVGEEKILGQRGLAFFLQERFQIFCYEPWMIGSQNKQLGVLLALNPGAKYFKNSTQWREILEYSGIHAEAPSRGDSPFQKSSAPQPELSL